MAIAKLRSTQADGSNGGLQILFFYRFFMSAVANISILIFATLFLFSSSLITNSVDVKLGVVSSRFNGIHSIRRSVLAVKSDPLKPRVDSIQKQADDHRSLALAYDSFARKLKLKNSKLVRAFADLTRNYIDLLSILSYWSLFVFDDVLIDEYTLRQYKKEVKERIRLDNQLKIQKLKDTIFAVNEHLTKAKKQGAFSSLIAAKSIPKSL